MRRCKRLLGLLLTAVMLLSLCSCSEQERPLGTWEGEVDYTAMFNEQLSADELFAASGVTVEDAKLKVTFTFNQDGTMTKAFDEASARDILAKVVEEMMLPVLEAMGMEADSLDDYLAVANMTVDEVIDSVFSAAVLEEIFGDMEISGTYKIEGDKLYMIEEGGSAEEYHTFTVSGDTLTLQAPVGGTYESDAEQQAVGAMFPLTLKKTA